MTEVTTER